MAFTLLDLEKDVLNTLNEAYNSTAGDLATGSGGATIGTITGTGSSGASTIKALLNEEAQILARTCYPIPEGGMLRWADGSRTHLLSSFIPDSATVSSGAVARTITGSTYGSPIVITAVGHGYANGQFVTITGVGGNTAANGNWQIESVTTDTFTLIGSTANGSDTSGGTSTAINGNPLWAVRSAVLANHIPSISLVFSNVTALERSDPGWLIAATGTPARWYMEGQSIGLYPVPTATTTQVYVSGLAEPRPLAADTDTLPWLPDSLCHLLVYGVVVKLCKKNMDDVSLYPRAWGWAQLLDKERLDLWNKIDPAYRRAHYPTPPVSVMPSGDGA